MIETNKKTFIMVEIIVPLAVFASIVLIFYIFFSTRNKERLALIEKGMDASIFKASKKSSPALKYGMFFVGIGIGVIAGNILAVYTSLEPATTFISMILLFGGASLITFHLIETKKQIDKE